MRGGKMMNTNDIYLVNYRVQSVEPLMSITRLPEKEAFELSDKLYKANPYDGYEQRFGPNFEGYYHHRIKTEKWLYEEFIEIGGKPQTKHPLYFFVHVWDVAEKAWEGKAVKVVEKIALSKIDICDVSFLFGDSMAMLNNHNRSPLFLKDELLELLAKNGNNVEVLLDSINQQFGHKIIEAQIWNDNYFIKA
jgi:hypothetical protein